jgi:Holliday junction resolvasome RuvABC DNA-binding subunit
MGHRGAVLLSNGTTLTERPGIAQRRAEQIAALLTGAGLTGVEYRVRFDETPREARGEDDAALRLVTVELLP